MNRFRKFSLLALTAVFFLFSSNLTAQEAESEDWYLQKQITLKRTKLLAHPMHLALLKQLLVILSVLPVWYLLIG